MESKEEILKRNVEAIANCNVKYNVTHQGILNAMEEYANQVRENMNSKIYKYFLCGMFIGFSLMLLVAIYSINTTFNK
jgi:hypothetical protein